MIAHPGRCNGERGAQKQAGNDIRQNLPQGAGFIPLRLGQFHFPIEITGIIAVPVGSIRWIILDVI